MAAYSKAVAALDEFDATAAEYVALLDTQRALLEQGNALAVAESAVRGDALAVRAAARGRQLAPLRDALAAGAHQGVRAAAVRRRLDQMTHRGALLGAAAAEVAGRCENVRDTTGAALARLQQSFGAGKATAYGYPGTPHASLTLDTRG